MKAVLLCAGFATRMYPLTKNFPKPLLEVGGKPVLDYLVAQIMSLPAMEEIHLVSNAKFYSHFVQWKENHLAGGTCNTLPIHIHNDGCTDNDTRLGAAGDLKLAISGIGAPCRLLVVGGDNIFLFTLKKLWEEFLSGNDHLIPALVQTRLEELQRTGVLEMDEHNCIKRLHEKPENPPSTFTCPPLYFFQPTIWNQLDAFLASESNHDSPGYLIDYLAQRERIKGMQIDASRLDIGNMESYRNADRLLTESPSLAEF